MGLTMHRQKIDSRTRNASTPAEPATLKEALALRKRLLKRLRKGSERERKIARELDRCSKQARCGSAYCPVCERKRLRAQSRQAPAAEPQHKQQSILMVCASNIAPERTEWLWPNIIASGRVTGIVGCPGLGKSQVCIDIAARVSAGRDWPGGIANGAPGDVIILSAEDDLAQTIVPRLMAADAECRRVRIIKAVKDRNGSERQFSLACDLDRLEREEDLRGVKLVVIDPATAYLGSNQGKRINRNVGDHVRELHNRLAVFADKHNLAVVTIAHLNKAKSGTALTRVTGSAEWVAAPRAVFVVTDESGSDRRLFVPMKNNLAPTGFGHAFRIENRTVAQGVPTSAAVWEPTPISMTADEALGAPTSSQSGAMGFLQQLLRHGPADQQDIIRLGKEAGLSEKVLRTARERLGVKTAKLGFADQGKWQWALPTCATVGSADASKSEPECRIDQISNSPTQFTIEASSRDSGLPDATSHQVSAAEGSQVTVADPEPAESTEKGLREGNATMLGSLPKMTGPMPVRGASRFAPVPLSQLLRRHPLSGTPTAVKKPER